MILVGNMDDKYIDGLIAAYNKVLSVMDSLDPEKVDLSFNLLRLKIEGALYGYNLMKERHKAAEITRKNKNNC